MEMTLQTGLLKINHQNNSKTCMDFDLGNYPQEDQAERSKI
jgi:hypothetical protein